MIKNYFKIAWRNIKKNRLYFLINLVGLSVGLATCLLIGLYVSDELNYDRFQEKADRIVRVTMEYKASENINRTASTGTKVGPEFKRRFPAVSNSIRTYTAGKTVDLNNQSYTESRVLYADPAFFEVFSFDLLKGNKSEVLNAPDKVVITESTARKYFGDQTALGQTLTIGRRPMTISGIAEDSPNNSQIKFDFVIQFESYSNSVKVEQWWTANWYTYLLVEPNTDITGLNTQINDYMNSLNIRSETGMEGESYLNYHLEPLLDVHLYSDLAGHEPNGSMANLKVLIGISILILIIAIANYTNLAVAQTTTRNAEVGVRKVMGANKKQVFAQFISESALITFLASLVAIVIIFLLLPSFNEIAGKQFVIQDLFRLKYLLILLVFSGLVSVLAGLYPAIVLSKSKVINILKKGFTAGNKQPILQNALIVLQFGTSMFLIIFTLIIMKQVDFMHQKDLGYDRDNIVVIPIRGKTGSDFEPLKRELLNTNGVISVTASYETPEFVEWGDGIHVEKENGPIDISLNALPVDLDFAKTLKMEFIAGRDFIESDYGLMDTTDNYTRYRQPYIINETLAKKIGWTPEEAIGQQIERNTSGPVIGVVKDFNFNSLYQPVGPMLIFLNRNFSRILMARVQSNNIKGTLANVKTVWGRYTNNQSFDYHFLDEDYNKLYASEQRQFNLFGIASLIAIILACLGLFGLAAFHTLMRRKEIGIRKTLGADLKDLLFLTIKHFMVLIITAIIIAIPIAWWTGNQWLQGFAYRIDPGIGVTVVASIITISIALATVAYHAPKAAMVNPVKSLRTE